VCPLFVFSSAPNSICAGLADKPIDSKVVTAEYELVDDVAQLSSDAQEWRLLVALSAMVR